MKMAPIQTFEGSHFGHGSVMSMVPSVCQCGGLFKGFEWRLPISRRGCFFSDSFFENARSSFDASVNEMLQKWKEMDAIADSAFQENRHSSANNFSLYRQLRSRLQEENQASTIVSDDKSYKVVMDVHDIADGDVLKVKVVGDKEVVVEGQGSASTNSGAYSSKRFCRRYIFPSSVNMAEITSVISADGVLTIEAPIEESSLTNKHSGASSITNKTNSSSLASTSCESSSLNKNMAESAKQTGVSDVVYYCKGCNKKIGSWHNAPVTKTPHDDGVKVPIKIGTFLTKAHQTIPVVQDTHQSNSQVKIIDIEREADMETANQEQQVKVIDVERVAEMQTANQELQQQQQQQHKVAVGTDSSLQQCNARNFNVPVMAPFRMLPILRRGPFFSDYFFKDIHKEFQSAVQEILSNWGTTPSSFFETDLPMYRSLRLRNLKEETQAVKSVEDETSHKFVLDVHDFLDGGEITVKAVNDREIVVEGHIDKEEGGSKSLKRFLKRFNVPGDIKLSSITSVMSSDGVLTITAPKKPSSVQLTEMIIPVDVEGRKEDKVAASEKFTHKNSSVALATAQHAHEHIIPINVEEASSNIKMKNEHSRQIKIERESNQNIHEASKHITPKDQTKVEHIIPVSIESDSNVTDATSIVSQSDIKKISQDHRLQSNQQQSQIVQGSSEHIIPICVEGSSHDSEAKITQNKVQENRQEKYGEIQHQAQNSAHSHSDKCQFAHQRAQASSKEEKIKSNANSESLVCGANKKYLPITRRGLFFEDTFFQDYHRNFQAAVKDVLIKSRQCIDTADNMSVYRNLRQKDLKVENQALHVQEDGDSLKIVVDAKDFTNGDITVYIDGEELVIEGKAENSEAKSSSSLTFSHRFLLPELADFSAISSAISSDGILTVRSPKGVPSKDAVRKMATEAKSKHESEIEGGHKWEEKSVKESSEQGDGFSARRFSTSYSSCQQQTF